MKEVFNYFLTCTVTQFLRIASFTDLLKITPPSLQVLIFRFSEQPPHIFIAQLQIL